MAKLGGIGRGAGLTSPPNQPAYGGGGFASSNTSGFDGGAARGFGGGGAPSSGGRGFGSGGGFAGGDTSGGFAGSGGGGFGGGGGGGGASTGRGCFKCGQEGHIGRDCPSGGGGGRPNGGDGGGGGGDGCRSCGEQGHFARECPSVKCYRCSKTGHTSQNCTEPDTRASGEVGEDGRAAPVTYVPPTVDEKTLWEEGQIQKGAHFTRFFDVEVQRSGTNPHSTPEITSFAEAKLTPLVLENVERMYDTPTPIQRHAIPAILAGRDCMACAQTGSGKTAAFMLPLITSILQRGDLSTENTSQDPAALIIAPTRELAIQISNEGKRFASGTMVKVVVVYGGVSVSHQMQQVARGCSVLVATPGRLKDFVNRGVVSLKKCRFLVLDEADRMLDMGFEQDVRAIAEHADMIDKERRQTLMFSATFAQDVQKLARDFLRADFIFFAVGIVGAANRDILQDVIEVTRTQKKELLLEKLATDMQVYGGDASNANFNKKTLVFVETKRQADFLATLLSENNISSTSIHGDRNQEQRETALASFKRGKTPVLVATAVAARGLDIKGVDHVVNYDMPKEIDDYVHRIGRTGRVGNSGRATTFFDSENDSGVAAALLKILVDAQQTVPQFLQQLGGGGYGGGGGSSSNFFGASSADNGGDDWG